MAEVVMSATTRWTVAAAGLVFALSGFLEFTAAMHFWTALLLGAIVTAFGGAAASQRGSWQGALITLVGIWMLAGSFVGEVQTGVGHLWMNLLTGLVLMALALFVHEPVAAHA
jgi:hypothetical protein